MPDSFENTGTETSTHDFCLVDYDSSTGYKKHSLIILRNNMLYGTCRMCQHCKKFWSLDGRRLDGQPGPSQQKQQAYINKIEQQVYGKEE